MVCRFSIRKRGPSEERPLTRGLRMGLRPPDPEESKEKRKMLKEIYKVCVACGITANYLTCLKKYGQPPLKFAFDISTFHTAKCDVCGHEESVTEPRDFFYPDFSLILRKIKPKQ